MATIEPLYILAGITPYKLSREENLFLETELFIHVCEELKKYFGAQFKEYFCLIKHDLQTEDVIMEDNFFRCVINDILSTEEYSLSGIAYQTRFPEDVIYEVAAGLNANPSLSLAKKIIDIHRSIKPELYREIINKITEAFLKVKLEEEKSV